MGELIRTGRAAAILGASRQHVVDLVERGVLANHGEGVHRRVDRAAVEALAGIPMPREVRLRLWVHLAVAGRIVRGPVRSNRVIARRLDSMSLAASAEGRSTATLMRWRRLLALGPEAVLQGMTEVSEAGDALRRESPVLGLLSEADVRRIERMFAIAQRPSRPVRRDRERAWPRRRLRLGRGDDA